MSTNCLGSYRRTDATKLKAKQGRVFFFLIWQKRRAKTDRRNERTFSRISQQRQSRNPSVEKKRKTAQKEKKVDDDVLHGNQTISYTTPPIHCSSEKPPEASSGVERKKKKKKQVDNRLLYKGVCAVAHVLYLKCEICNRDKKLPDFPQDSAVVISFFLPWIQMK